ncbi:hypothetical protein GGR16_002620 [Chelatococcus caeni]|uniref:Uncharacterized protein n=1 Tax=Chelatococcus caeni TaxID=1348468 RepID=A0A840C3S1_9HYPH|nr:hypothetical protein [Chelatococcus caeni]MBB4017586.1 hypothetical protein [Chelatococcus caeni]
MDDFAETVWLDKTEEGSQYGSTPVKVPDDAEKAAPAQLALIEQWIERVKHAKRYFEKDFERMDKCEQLATDGAEQEWIAGNNYTVPVTNRHINLAVAALYARNPTIVAKRRKRLQFQLWDGNPETLIAAMQAAQGGVDPATGMVQLPDPNAIALVQEVQQAKQYNQMVERMGKTMEILSMYFFNEQTHGYKEEFKQLVRRAKTTGVGYVKLGFQRILQKRPDVIGKIQDVTDEMAAIQAAMQDAAEGKLEADSARLGELETMLQALQQEPDLIVREGPVFDFPRSKEIIIDPKCRNLRTLAGARWLAHEFEMTPEEIKETYGIDVGTAYTSYDPAGNGINIDSTAGKDCRGVAKVWEVQDSRTQTVFTICDGYPNWLKAPAPPDVKIDRFFTVFPLVFNQVENSKKLYPPSDVWLMRHPQQEYNRARQGLREHRQANRPKYAVAKGKFEETDLQKLENHPSSAILALKGLGINDKVENYIQRIPLVSIDPSQYEVEGVFSDILRVVGSQEANFGATQRDVTATQSSIAEQSRTATIADYVDDLDDMLTQLSRGLGQLMLLEMSKEKVVEIVGPGAVWPEQMLTREQVVQDLFLDIQAGSSGRPNQAAELAKWERATPLLIQIPGIGPKPIARKLSELLDIDLDELYIEGLPSIMALNAMAGKQAQPGTGDPANDPNAQGDQGAQNARRPPQNEPGPQPAYPAPASGLAPMQNAA